ncbi:hypothetical protein HFBEMICV_CDS0006 [Escherichia phage 216Ecol046PP]|uniref:Uncharacterized protein n=1 Tax=Escherichia phage 216Ecol046PP TaxID=3126517 RepID=A0ABZ2I6B2_9CAUD
MKTVYINKPSSHSRVEQIERDMFLHRRMRAEGHKYELMSLAFGGRPITDDGKLLVSGWKAIDQRSTIKHTTHGDFSHLHANPLICK